jgi:hypothetical protein
MNKINFGSTLSSALDFATQELLTLKMGTFFTMGFFHYGPFARLAVTNDRQSPNWMHWPQLMVTRVL